MDTDGEVFRKQVYAYQELLELMIKFLESKGLYNEYMRWKESQL